MRGGASTHHPHWDPALPLHHPGEALAMAGMAGIAPTYGSLGSLGRIGTAA
jgi:hypothetical protein